MTLLELVEQIGEAPTAALLGLVTGITFGVAAQRSRFCLRAACVEFARGQLGDKVAVWFLTFSTAVVWVQLAQATGLMRAEDARMMAVPGSWSGAVIGGLVLRFLLTVMGFMAGFAGAVLGALALIWLWQRYFSR